jgi:hypothetical protein
VVLLFYYLMIFVLIDFHRCNSKGNQDVFSTILHKKDAEDFSPTSKSIAPFKSLRIAEILTNYLV